MIRSKIFAFYNFRSLLLSLVVVSVWPSLACSQQATPSARPTLGISVEPPQGWAPEAWARLRQSCLDIKDKVDRREPLTDSDIHGREICIAAASKMGAPGTNAPPAPVPARSPRSVSTAVPGASPQSRNFSPAVSAMGTTGTFGTPFAGGGDSACANAYIQPPDVAADVSPTQNAELLNQGLWVFDKRGNTLSQTSLSNFWCPSGSNNPLPGCGKGNTLTDTQIVYDQIANRWLATTMSINGVSGNLYLAVSNNSSAVAGNWTLYAYPNVCPNPNNTLPDQPILGFNGNWLVIDVLCGNSDTEILGLDSILTIPHSSITQNTLPSSLSWGIQSSNFAGQRPSRDIGATSTSDSYPDVFLVTSQTPTGGFASVVVQQIGPSSSNPPPITEAGQNGGRAQSPGNGVATDSGMIAPAAQPGCSSSSNCAVILGDARIKSASFVQVGNDGKHYLMTSFMAKDQQDQTAQALWYLGQIETFTTGTPQWNTWYVGGYTQSNAWAAFPTITMDKDLDVNYNFETFSPNFDPYPNWYSGKGFAPSGALFSDPPVLDFNVQDSAQSTGVYTGQLSCKGSQPQPRWGDYVSAVWDQNFSSPSGESGAFWTVQQFTTGGANQSTEWQAIADPLPFFVDSKEKESECNGGSGTTCTMNFTVPPTAQYGDLILVHLLLGQPATKNPGLPDSSWTLLSASNITGSPQAISATNGGFTWTSWIAAHIYGSTTSDTGTYSFTHHLNLGAEFVGLMLV